MVEGWVLDEIREFLKSRVILTGVDLDLFTRLEREPSAAGDLADDSGFDKKALRRLLDCLVAHGLLEKKGRLYTTSERGAILSSGHPETELPMAQHLAGMWDSWGGLTDIVKTGENPRRRPGTERDDESLAAFIGAMHVVGRDLAVEIADDYDLSPYKKLLDIGGASGTYTIAFLRENPGMTAVLFDLPRVIPMAEKRLTEEGLMARVELVAGDFYEDELPGGCDLALLSAIIHQNSPGENLDLYKKIYRALAPGGVLLVRDHVMDEDRLNPPAGAIFAINMLVHTRGGDTYTFSEIEGTMEEAGFADIRLVRRGPKMDCLVEGRKPA